MPRSDCGIYDIVETREGYLTDLLKSPPKMFGCSHNRKACQLSDLGNEDTCTSLSPGGSKVTFICVAPGCKRERGEGILMPEREKDAHKFS